MAAVRGSALTPRKVLLIEKSIIACKSEVVEPFSRRQLLRGITGTAAVASGMGLAWASGYGKVAYANPVVRAVGILVATEIFKDVLAWFIDEMLDKYLGDKIRESKVTDVPESEKNESFHKQHSDYKVEDVKIEPTPAKIDYKVYNTSPLYVEVNQLTRCDDENPLPAYKDVNTCELNRVKHEWEKYKHFVYPCGERFPCDTPKLHAEFENVCRRYKNSKGVVVDPTSLTPLYARPVTVLTPSGDKVLDHGFGVSSVEEPEYKDLLIPV